MHFSINVAWSAGSRVAFGINFSRERGRKTVLPEHASRHCICKLCDNTHGKDLFNNVWGRFRVHSQGPWSGVRPAACMCMMVQHRVQAVYLNQLIRSPSPFPSFSFSIGRRQGICGTHSLLLSEHIMYQSPHQTQFAKIS